MSIIIILIIVILRPVTTFNCHMPPSIFLSDLNNHSLTFYWKDHPNWYIGYRLSEGAPWTMNEPSTGLETQPARSPRQTDFQPGSLPAPVQPPYPEWRSEYQEPNPDDPAQFAFHSCVDNVTRCSARLSSGPLDLVWLFEPCEDGIWITLQATARAPIPGTYGLLQCLRFTGNLNEYWRRKVALAPFLSEFDLQAMGQPNWTLTFARREERWLEFPVPYTRLATLAGLPLLTQPAPPVDHGLALRQSLDRRISPAWYLEQVAHGAAWDVLTAGMYWERTLLISNRHPADCIHAIIDLAPLQPGQSRQIHGKFYCIEGAKEDLLERWRQDFR
jgi:hypothetical protein